MEKDDKGSTMIRTGVSGWMFLLVPAYPGYPGSKAVKRSLLLLLSSFGVALITDRMTDHKNTMVNFRSLQFRPFCPVFGSSFLSAILFPFTPTFNPFLPFVQSFGKHANTHPMQLYFVRPHKIKNTANVILTIRVIYSNLFSPNRQASLVVELLLMYVFHVSWSVGLSKVQLSFKAFSQHMI